MMEKGNTCVQLNNRVKFTNAVDYKIFVVRTSIFIYLIFNFITQKSVKLKKNDKTLK